MLQGFGKDIKGLEKACYESVEDAKKAAAEANNETVSHEKRMLFILNLISSISLRQNYVSETNDRKLNFLTQYIFVEHR